MIVVVVRDTPVPQGSHVAVVSRSTGKAFVKRANEKTEKTWRGRVIEEVAATVAAVGRCPDPQCGDSTWDHDCQLSGNPYPLDGPVILAVTFTVAKPKSAPKTRVTWPERKPDLDKLLRSVMDALKAGGAYKDDAQVVEILRLGKFYPDPAARVIPGSSAAIMSAVAGTDADVLPVPGAVIRVAAIHEFFQASGHG